MVAQLHSCSTENGPEKLGHASVVFSAYSRILMPQLIASSLTSFGTLQSHRNRSSTDYHYAFKIEQKLHSAA
jgi:hypothetical protein